MLRKYHRFPETLPIITIKSKIKSTASCSCLLLCLEMRENKKEVDNLCKGTCKLGTDISIRFLCPDCLQPFHQHTSFPSFFLLCTWNTDWAVSVMARSHRDAVEYTNNYLGFAQKLTCACKVKRKYELSTDSSASSTPKALTKHNKSSSNYILKKNISNTHMQSVIQP